LVVAVGVPLLPVDGGGQIGRPQLVLGVPEGAAELLGGTELVGGADELGTALLLGGVLDSVGVGVALELVALGVGAAGCPICWTVANGWTGLPLR